MLIDRDEAENGGEEICRSVTKALPSSHELPFVPFTILASPPAKSCIITYPLCHRQQGAHPLYRTVLYPLSPSPPLNSMTANRTLLEPQRGRCLSLLASRNSTNLCHHSHHYHNCHHSHYSHYSHLLNSRLLFP
ncbi:hypothetical protein EJ06DRAFT_525700 [Trichodelitschia bisporula]|uniref:Uncharacterized protein n=1 Tax=Trichodelitschia bisporula TaxID=703511 RepID=A0A6G1IA50_9PEZI|nr:hypothetical protein EJ06DRAFT_525700 [Trichodelitschia bisporula]